MTFQSALTIRSFPFYLCALLLLVLATKLRSLMCALVTVVCEWSQDDRTGIMPFSFFTPTKEGEKMKTSARFLLAMCLAIGSIFGGTSVAQNQAAGSPDFAAMENHGDYSINLQTLDVTINIPIHSRPAGHFGFSSGLLSNCSEFNNGGYKWMCGGINTSSSALYSETTSLLSAQVRWTVKMSDFCVDGVTGTTDYSGWEIVYPDGTVYAIEPSAFIDSRGCLYNTWTAQTYGTNPATLTLNVTGNSGSALSYSSTILLADGTTVTTANGASPTTVKDTFGNTLSVSSGTYTDYLGTTALTTGTNSWSYTDATGTNRTVSATVSQHTQETNFNCSGVSNVTNANSYFVTGISYPDSTSMSLGYESQVSGTYTGRVNSIRNRTGGTTTFSYGTMNCGTNGGGGQYPTSLTRVTPDGTYTYTMGTSPSKVTTVLDPGKNKTVYTFSGGYDTVYPKAAVLTQVQKYQNTGTVSNPSYTLLTTDVICYNGNQTNCPTATVNFNFTEKDVYHTIAGMSSSARVKTLFDSHGNVTEVDRYDFGASSPDTVTTTTYGSWNGSSCTALSGITDHPCQITAYNGARTVTLAQTNLTYNAAGALTQKQQWAGGSNFLTTTYTPNSNGTVASMTSPNGLITTYAYNGTGCNNFLPTSVTVGSLPAASVTYECNGGTTENFTDINGNGSQTEFDDPLLRLTSSTDRAGLTTTTSYTSNAVTSSASFGSSSMSAITTVDGLGRPVLFQSKHGSSYDTNQPSYDFSGTNPKINAQEPCITSLGSGCPTVGVTKTSDFLGRPLTVVDANGGTTTYTYNQNDVIATLSPAPSGEHTKTVQTEYDGLGRVKSVCHLLSSGGTSCGQVAGGSGILDTYSYSYASAAMTVTVTRGAQTHSKTYDALGRLISNTTPEAGTATYKYDVSTPCNRDKIAEEKNGPADCYQQPTSPDHHRRTIPMAAIKTVPQLPQSDNSIIPPLEVRHGVVTLFGYGIRVRVDRGHLLLEDGIGADRRNCRLPRVGHGLRRLVVIGSDGMVSLAALRWLADQDASFVMLERDGTVLLITGPVRPSEVKLRRAQALAHSSGAALRITRELISRKLDGQERVAHDKLLDTLTADTIARFKAELPTADTIPTIRLIESQAARAYWSAWSTLPVNFPKNDLPRIPTHWLSFGGRVSPLTGSPRLAANPLNAILNYLYSVLESEARLAAAALGLDPGLGVLHTDTSARDSLACDLMEPIRPHVDAYLLDWITRQPLRRAGKTWRAISSHSGRPIPP